MNASSENPASDVVHEGDAPRDESTELTASERSILEVEKSWWRIAATKEQAIRKELGVTPTRYYLILNQLVDDPRAFRAEPQLVDRLRRLRDARLEERR